MTESRLPGSPGNTGTVLLRWFNPLSRSLGFAWLGVLMFAIDPPRPGALVAQVVCYAVTGIGLAGWILLLDVRATAVPHRSSWLAVSLGLMAVAAGYVATTGGGAPFLVIYAGLAAMAAAGDLALGPALAVAGAGVLAAAIGSLFSSSGYGAFLDLSLIIAGGLIVGRNRAAYRIQAEQSAALLAQREQLSAADRRADLLDERARIAREIHDVLAHSLGALAIQIQAARSVLTDRGDVEQAAELLSAAQRMAAEGLTDTRRALHALRADTLPVDEELARATDTYAERYHVTATFAQSGETRPVPPEATVALLRIAQEALINAAKHAPGEAVTLELEYRQADVMLRVSNDLTSFDRADANGGGHRRPGLQTANAGYGLTGMQERLRLLGGTLNAGRQDGSWIVTALVPVPAAESMTHEHSEQGGMSAARAGRAAAGR
ncbi:MAG TPA: histidine kinase [Streptosporangiaceae bacterium]|jgi:signal transduction histidine kinase